METSVNEQRRLELLSRVFIFLILALALGTGAYAWTRGTVSNSPEVSQQAVDQPQDKLLLTSADSATLQASNEGVAPPAWMIGLITGVLVLQLGAVARAADIASQPRLSREHVKRIELLAELPMYLGLLGSLMGVCITQFVSGSLAAPLAYLTTISGITVYLFARFYRHWNNYAFLCRETRRFEESLRAYETALELAPDVRVSFPAEARM